MENKRVTTVGVDQSIFRASAKRGDSRASQPLPEIVGQGAAQVGPARLDRDDAPAVEHMGKAAHGGLDFGKLGHGGRMAEQAQAR